MDLNEDEDRPRNDQDEADNEDDEDEEMDEGGDGEFISLVDVLDGEADVDMGNDGTASKHPLTKGDKLTRESVAEDEGVNGERQGEEEESSSIDEEKLDFAPDDDEAAPEALDELENFITSLKTSDKKRKDHPDSNASTSQEPKRKKHHIIRERTEAGTENEFRAQASSTFLATIVYDLLMVISTKRLKTSARRFAFFTCVSVVHPPRTQKVNQSTFLDVL